MQGKNSNRDIEAGNLSIALQKVAEGTSSRGDVKVTVEKKVTDPNNEEFYFIKAKKHVS